MAKSGANNQAAKDNEAAAISFEQAMEKLESIVTKLENGDVPLETAIELFQEGMTLSKLCGQKLEQVERRIEMLVEGDSGLQRKAFSPGKEESSGDKGE